MNKMFKKLMAVSATVAIAATMSVSAFAADVTVAPTDGAVTVTPTEVKDATMYTVMVFSCAADADIAKATPANATAIYYINQGADVKALVSNMLVKATNTTEYLPAGNYVVRIGNDQGSVQNFALESKIAEDDTVKLIFGDVNGDEKANADDALCIAVAFAGGDKAVGGLYDIGELIVDNLYFGDVNGDGKVNADDALCIAVAFAGGDKAVGGSYNIGAEYEVPAK